jgi:serine/threonine-protein phosphatase 4 regulatory subunit 4
LALQEQLNSAMSNLMTDNDRDVLHAARTVHDTFKRTPLRVTGGAGLLEMNGSSSGVCV